MPATQPPLQIRAGPCTVISSAVSARTSCILPHPHAWSRHLWTDRRPGTRCRALSRRSLGQNIALTTLGLVTAGVVGVSAARASGQRLFGPKELTMRGMEAFQNNELEKALLCFDKVIEISPSMYPYMWQRGLTLYYLGRYEEGAKQFRDDVAVNPNDTEEAIWAWMCEAKVRGSPQATKDMMKVGKDPRPVMRTAYEAFSGRADPKDMLRAGGSDEDSGAFFYATLYYGLWHEGHGDAVSAKESMLRAVRSKYAQTSGDFMAAVAWVHCKRRNWT